jgi:Skp family chaperone for outer membrane proteins
MFDQEFYKNLESYIDKSGKKEESSIVMDTGNTVYVKKVPESFLMSS